MFQGRVHGYGSSGGKSTLFCALVSSGWKAKAQGSRKGGVCVYVLRCEMDGSA